MKQLLFSVLILSSFLLLISCESDSSSPTPHYTVTLTPSPAEGGNVSAPTQVYDEGSVATVAATPVGEWVFARWEGDLTGTTSISTITVDSDKSITAIFEKKIYALTVNTSGEGTVDEQIVQAKAADYESGTVVELTAIPAEGWEFKEWAGAISDTTNPIQLTIDDPKQVTAIFIETTPSYTVTLTPSPIEGGSVSAASQNYNEGSVATISATPASEWEFVRWEGDYIGNSSTSTLTVDSDKNITAVFQKKNYALTINTSGEGTVNEQIIQAKTTDYESGTIVELTATPAEGWGFKKWQGAVTGSENPIQITVDDPKQITAVFESFYIASNGVTVKCEAAKIGATGTVNGITYTKRTAELITINNASTSCTSDITDMSSLFSGELSFNEDISSWDVSSVTDMGGMFFQATAFNQDISQWDVSAVTDMNLMFSTANTFNQDLTDWDVSAVTNMRLMFSTTYNFNEDLSSWDVSNVTNMEGMFYQTNSFNQDISNWDVSAVTNMGSMFAGALLFNGDLSNWDVSAVTSIDNMFNGAVSFNGDISNWDVSSVTVMSSLFRGASSFNQDLSSWNVSAVTRMSSMFFQATSFNQDIGNWDVSAVTNMSSMFAGATSFNQDFSNWDVGSVFDMDAMFQDALSFNQDLSGWCVTNIPSEPADFSTGSPLTNPNKPVWGTCPAP